MRGVNQCQRERMRPRGHRPALNVPRVRRIQVAAFADLASTETWQTNADRFVVES